MKLGGREMENLQVRVNMMLMFERMLRVAAIVERLMQWHMQFNRKGVSRYMQDYKAEMLQCIISAGLQVFRVFKGASTKSVNSIQRGRHLKKR